MSSPKLRAGIKRALDTALILLCSPLVLLALVGSALAVRVTMGSPVFFTQRRIGLREAPFSVLKFRTMSNARDINGKLLPDSARLTKTGRVLRKLSLDELPQLINVLRGEMALVGPRPLLAAYLPFYRDRERLRHSVRPGITGAAQVAGRNGVLWEQRLGIDADYAESGTLLDDARIILTTLKRVVRIDGVSVIAGDSGERLDVVRSYPSDGVVALRRLEVADAETRVRWFEDPRTFAKMNVPVGVTVEGTREWILKSRGSTLRKDFVGYDIESGKVLVMLGIRGHNDPASVEVHVLVDPERHGEGFGSTGMRLLLTWLESHPSILGAWLTVHPENQPAIRLYERLGFSVAGDSGPDRLRMELKWGRADD
ncbi:GNAT family N-acetyltransferase [Microbacterium alcoholitolerans]|uniref:GNAT family N-acetyltransferase n=1 Tax=unclassified Microbacterium TaxID=2609290 RepID=UPI003D16D695